MKTLSDKLSLRQKLGFGIGDFAINLMFQGVGLFLLYFYTDVAGIPAATAGFIYMIALIWDGITDPLMGYLANRTRTRWGKYRPYLLWGAVPMAASFVMLFVKVEAWSTTALVWYAFWTNLLFRTLYTIVSIPYNSLSAEITQDSNERGSLAAYRMVCAVAAGLLVATLTKGLVVWLGAGNEAIGYGLVMLGYAIIAVVVIWLCFGLVRERGHRQERTHAHYSFREIWQALWSNRPFWLISAVVMAGSISYTMTNKMILYYFKYFVGNEKATSLGLLCLISVVMFAVPVWSAISARIGKRRVALYGNALSLMTYVLLYFNPATNLGLVLLNFALIGIGTASGVFSFWAILPDTVEYGEWQSGKRTESIIFGLASFYQKVGLGIGVGLVGVLLEAIGYVPNVAQTPATLQGMLLIMVLIPMAGVAISMAAMWFYDLDAARHAQIVAEIRARENDQSKTIL